MIMRLLEGSARGYSAELLGELTGLFHDQERDICSFLSLEFHQVWTERISPVIYSERS